MIGSGLEEQVLGSRERPDVSRDKNKNKMYKKLKKLTVGVMAWRVGQRHKGRMVFCAFSRRLSLLPQAQE